MSSTRTFTVQVHVSSGGCITRRGQRRHSEMWGGAGVRETESWQEAGGRSRDLSSWGFEHEINLCFRRSAAHWEPQSIMDGPWEINAPIWNGKGPGGWDVNDEKVEQEARAYNKSRTYAKCIITLARNRNSSKNKPMVVCKLLIAPKLYDSQLNQNVFATAGR